jgi:hypothetical protein
MAVADVTQTTAASQPLLLAHSGVNYWWGSGVAGNYCSTPNAAANQITGNIEFIAKVNFQDSGNQDTIFIKSDAVAGSSFCYSFWKNGNSLSLTYSNGGTVAARVSATSSATLSSVGYTYGTDIWVKGNRSASTGDVNFYYSYDGITYTQLGATQPTTAQSMFNASIPLWVGDWANILFQFKGKIYRATISNSIGGAPVVDFNPATYNAAVSQTSWTSSTSEIWTINTGTAATGYKGVLVDRTITQGDGVDDILVGSSAVIGTTFTNYTSFNSYASYGGSGKVICGVDSLSGSLRQSSNTQIGVWYSGSVTDLIVSKNINSLGLATFTGNGVSGAVLAQVNNGTAVTGTGTVVNAIYKIFGNDTFGFSSCIINTSIITNSVNNITQRTALYNIIRSMNGDAF